MMVGTFDTNPLAQTLQHYSTCLNVDNVTEDTYELDEIKQWFQR
jgi:hypothetical protein